MWIKYTDSSKHPELKAGRKFCVKTPEGIECYARFVIYNCGTEVDFLSLDNGRSIDAEYFRELDATLDLYERQESNLSFRQT